MNHDSSIPLPKRCRPVHQPVRQSGHRSTVVFLTVCVIDRRPVLAHPEMHTLLREAWSKADRWLVGRYVIMPDHIHLFCAPGTNPPESMTSWVSYWKRLVAFTVGDRLWQKNFWDTQLRHHESYDAKWVYVRQNPVRAGLVGHPDEWRFQGVLNLLRWHA
jgi:putative transposase